MNLSPSLKYHSKITSSKVEAILNKKKTVIKFNYKDCSDVNVELLVRAAMVPFMELELCDSQVDQESIGNIFHQNCVATRREYHRKAELE